MTFNSTFQQNIATQKSCHNKPHNTHQFEKNNNVNASTFSQELQICGFLFVPAKSLTPQLSVLATRLAGLPITVPWPKYKKLFGNMQIECFLKYVKYVTLPTSPSPVYC